MRATEINFTFVESRGPAQIRQIRHKIKSELNPRSEIPATYEVENTNKQQAEILENIEYNRI